MKRKENEYEKKKGAKITIEITKKENETKKN